MIMSKKDLIRCKLPTRDVGFYLKCQWDPCDPFLFRVDPVTQKCT